MTLNELILSNSITIFYKKRKEHLNTSQEVHSEKGIKMIKLGKSQVILLSSSYQDSYTLPEYYLKDKHDQYHLYENTKELQELVDKYISVNG